LDRSAGGPPAGPPPARRRVVTQRASEPLALLCVPIVNSNCGYNPHLLMSEEATSLRTPWTTTSVEESRLLRKLTEQRLESDQLRLLGSAVRVAVEGIAILTPAVEALGPRIAFVNDGFCAIYGRSREEIIGETPIAFGIVDRHHAIFDSLLQHVFARQAFAA